MTEGKNIIQQLLQEYNFKASDDIQDALKNLLNGTIKEIMKLLKLFMVNFASYMKDGYQNDTNYTRNTGGLHHLLLTYSSITVVYRITARRSKL